MCANSHFKWVGMWLVDSEHSYIPLKRVILGFTSHLGLIFACHKTLAFEQRCVDFLYPPYLRPHQTPPECGDHALFYFLTAADFCIVPAVLIAATCEADWHPGMPRLSPMEIPQAVLFSEGNSNRLQQQNSTRNANIMPFGFFFNPPFSSRRLRVLCKHWLVFSTVHNCLHLFL